MGNHFVNEINHHQHHHSSNDISNDVAILIRLFHHLFGSGDVRKELRNEVEAQKANTMFQAPAPSVV